MTSPRRICQVVFNVAAITVLASAWTSAAVAAADKPECVGRFAFNLPGEVEVAIPRARYMVDEQPDYVFVSGNEILGHYLPDGTYAERVSGDDPTWNEQQSLDLRLVSGPEMNHETFENFKLTIEKGYHNRQEELLARHDKGRAERIRPAPTDLPDAFVWMNDTYQTIYMLRGNRVFRFEGSTSSKFPADQDRIRFVSSHLRSRPLYEVPTEPGLCLHYGFLPDDPKYDGSRQIGVTYRLKDHPDVDIYFLDQTANRHPDSRNKENTAADEVTFFWEANYGGTDKQRRILSPHIPGVVQYPSVKLADHKGKASFVEMTHEDGSLDYGYMAYVKGDPDAKTESPNLMLYVIRTAARAKGAPVGKDELKAMADRIAASVRLHPLQP